MSTLRIIISAIVFSLLSSGAIAQDATTINTNNTNTTTATNTNVNVNSSVVNSNATNNNINSSVSTSTSNVNSTTNSFNETINVSDATINQTSSNININQSNNISDNTNTNYNENVTRNESVQRMEQDISSPPPSAIAPSIGSSYSQDLCTTGISGSVQTQIFGLSTGKSVTDENCERIKLSKTLYDMGMRVAAVALMCQDERVWTAMKMAGTPCPYEGMIGSDALVAWESNRDQVPGYSARRDRNLTSTPNMPRR